MQGLYLFNPLKRINFCISFINLNLIDLHKYVNIVSFIYKSSKATTIARMNYFMS